MKITKQMLIDFLFKLEYSKQDHIKWYINMDYGVRFNEEDVVDCIFPYNYKNITNSKEFQIFLRKQKIEDFLNEE